MKRKAEKRIEKAENNVSLIIKELEKLSFTDSFSDAVSIILKCKGKIITTGMGKAGIAMEKFSSTLCSLSFPSCFLHPGTASHGDLGVISKNDVLFVASTSGKTREVLEIVDSARNLGIRDIIGITSHPDSEIRKKVDIVLDMGIIEEGGHLSLAPTASIIIMLAITDSLALVCAEEKKITYSDYLKYHHSGYLGQIAKEKSNENK